MTVVGVDDTDSRDTGMCTTFVAHRIAARLSDRGFDVERVVLARLNPAVPHKTRGNASLAVHVAAPEAVARAVARDVVERRARVAAAGTNPGVVVAPGDPTDVPASVTEFANAAVREFHDPDRARELATDAGFGVEAWGNGRGVVGALAAVGAWSAFADWTHEHIAYRERDRWGSERDVDAAALFAAADDAYPGAFDTVDRETGDLVAVPRTPCPILLAVRGDDPEACRRVVDGTTAVAETESVRSRRTFVTNQGTDAHLRSAPSLAALADGRAYRVDATVAAAPETHRGGHVFVDLTDADATVDAGADAPVVREAAAFEPTKHFRDGVRADEALPGSRAVAGAGRPRDGLWRGERGHAEAGEVRAPRARRDDPGDAGLSGLRSVDEVRGPRPGLSLPGLLDDRTGEDRGAPRSGSGTGLVRGAAVRAPPPGEATRQGRVRRAHAPRALGARPRRRRSRLAVASRRTPAGVASLVRTPVSGDASDSSVHARGSPRLHG